MSCLTCTSCGTLSVGSLSSSRVLQRNPKPSPPDDTIARKVNGSDASSFAQICGCCPSQGTHPLPHLSRNLSLTVDRQCGASSGSSRPSPSSQLASSSASSRSRYVCTPLGPCTWSPSDVFLFSPIAICPAARSGFKSLPPDTWVERCTATAAHYIFDYSYMSCCYECDSAQALVVAPGPVYVELV